MIKIKLNCINKQGSFGKVLACHVPAEPRIRHSLMVVVMNVLVPDDPWVPDSLQVFVREKFDLSKFFHSLNQPG